ncbi:hypothetical protein ACWD33_26275 [Streptomyces xiamenensis]
MTDLDHLLSRARRGVLLPAEGEVLAAEVQRLRDARTATVCPDCDGFDDCAACASLRARLRQAIADQGWLDSDDAVRHLATVAHWAVMPELLRLRELEAALSAVAPPAPLSGPVAASGPLAGPERHPWGSTGRQTGAEGVALAAEALSAALDTPSTATSGPQGGVHGPDGPPEGQGSHGPVDGRTAARDGAR